MKGPFEYAKVYAVAANGKAGFAGGVIPAVFAYDKRTGMDLFFTISEDEFTDDVYDLGLAGEQLTLNSGEDPGWRIPDRQILSLWSEREEALLRFKARSERGKASVQTRKDREAADRRAAFEADKAAAAQTAEGRLEAIPGVDSVFRIIRGERDVVMFSMKLKPDTFRKITLALGIDQTLVEEYLIESELKIRAEGK